MKKFDSPASTALWKRIDEALFYDWDPIGRPLPRDEYRRYVQGVFDLVAEGASKATLAEHLLEVERRWGISPSGYHAMRPEVCKRVAAALVADWKRIQEKYGEDGDAAGPQRD